MHGDLALRNVLVNLSGGRGAPRCAITDFGLAHRENVPKECNLYPLRWVAPEVFTTKQ